MATPRMNTDEALAYYEELEDTELSELSSDEESDIDRCMAGFGDDSDQVTIITKNDLILNSTPENRL